MNASAIGIVLSLIFIGQIVHHAVQDLRVFNDIPGFILILGSTVAVALITYSARDVKGIGALMMSVFRSQEDEAPKVVTEAITLVKETDGDPRRLESVMASVKHPFLLEGVSLVVDRFDRDQIDIVMRDRTKRTKEDWARKTQSVKTLAKYPPAFGIMACVIGLISVMQKLGGELGPGELAPSMAVALVGTLIGLVASNYFIMPMGEKIALRAEQDVHVRKIIHQATLMIAAREPALVVQEKLNSFLSEHERVDVLGIGSLSRVNKAA
ncbi:MAG: MotA/TolQ/ExbB proton channel family protein [Silvanigrellales bacterium]|jgi:chemotaxis protein MotA|nr:MotA/TolQ/ExbB proton channel family protein [Silvanigrellales bacterium]